MDRVGQIRKESQQRWTELQSERSSWIGHYRELADFLLPRGARFYASDRNRGTRRHQQIIDGVATRAVNTLAAGMQSGMTSESQPWFEVTTADRDMAKSHTVKLWASSVTQLMRRIFSASNTYRALHSGYRQNGVFGTSAKVMVPDFKTVIHMHPLAAGGYAVATNWRGEVDTLYREFDKTVGQLVREFGREAVSDTVRGMFDRGQLDAWVTVIHAIEPRADRDLRRRDAQHMAWRSVYFEAGGDNGKLLRESGFSHFPGLVSRWEVDAEDIYGSSPGMAALGDVKQLQLQQLRKAQGIDYMTRPPLQVSGSLKNGLVDVLPGGVTYVEGPGQASGVSALFDVRLDLSHLSADIQDVRRSIEQAFHVDLFRMFDGLGPQGQRTATEVLERRQEKMVLLGPVVERQHAEELGPLIENTFATMVQAGIVPPPPPEMQGQPLQVEYVSVLARAQRAAEAGVADRFVQTLGVVAASGKADVLDKLDSDTWADWYADRVGLPPELLVTGDKLAFVRESRAQQQAALQQSAMANQAADTAHKLGATPADGGSLLAAMS